MEKSDFYREALHNLSGPLAGVRIVEATTSWAGPMCACLLADLGADVIKVEAPGGEVMRKLPPFLTGKPGRVASMFATVNRNKQSLTLDLRREPGRDLFLKLAAGADMVIENFRPGTMAAWGVGYEDVRSLKEDIIYVSLTGFGQFGPEHDRAGYDGLAQAASGFMSLNGSVDGPPVRAATFLADDLGGVHGAIAALAALWYHSRTGTGQHVDVALLDAMLFQSNGFPTLGAMGFDLHREGNRIAFAAPAGVYPCRDGSVVVGVLLDSHWKVLARLIGRPELAEDPRYVSTRTRAAHRDELDALLGEWLMARTVSEALETFASEHLPAAPVRTYAQAACNPHVLARDMLQPTVQEDGETVPIVGPAAKFSRTPTSVRTGAPALGAHSDEILDELGVGSAARERLRREKII